MRVLRWLVFAALVVAVVATPPETAAILKRKACRLGCTAAVDACVAAGGKRARCKRQTLKSCRKQGLEACATTSTTTSPGATTTTESKVASTTTLGGVTTTTAAAGSTTTIGGATTTTPGPTTSSTTVVVHGCNSSTATDLSGQPSPTVTFTSYQYTPPCARIVAGQTITFSGDLDIHPLVGGLVATPDPSSPIGIHASGSTAPIGFPSAGVYPYYCGAHGVTQNMLGAVFVDP
jgi:plastocyanin